MARIKVLTGRMLNGAAWLATGAATLAAAYEGSALAAHMGTWINWR